MRLPSLLVALTLRLAAGVAHAATPAKRTSPAS